MWRSVAVTILILAAVDWFLLDSKYRNAMMRMLREMALWMGFS